MSTICAECKHHEKRHHYAVDRCFAPAFCELKRNWVTGEYVPTTTVYCETINTDGNCPHFEAKEPVNTPPSDSLRQWAATVLGKTGPKETPDGGA